MIQFFLIPLFSIFGGDGEVGYTEYTVFLSTDVDEDCNRPHSNGCIRDVGIIVNNPWGYDPKGCTTLMHEWYHTMGYEENEIPYCVETQEFRK